MLRQMCTQGVERRSQSHVRVAVGETSDPQHRPTDIRCARIRLVCVSNRDKPFRPRETLAYIRRHGGIPIRERKRARKPGFPASLHDGSEAFERICGGNSEPGTAVVDGDLFEAVTEHGTTIRRSERPGSDSGGYGATMRATNHESDRGDKAGVGQGSEGRLLIIPDPGRPAAPRQQHRNDAVGARPGPVHHTYIAVDDHKVSFR